MTDTDPGHANHTASDQSDNLIPSGGYDLHPLVGLGGSAGGISALTTFFRALPPDPGLAFAVVLHLSPEHESTLAELLQRSTRMPVVQVTAPVTIEKNTVYVIPPRHALKVADGRLELEAMPGDRRRHFTVDLFFRTLADTHGPHAAAVVLSGADSDGAIGIKRIKERGGLTIAQDPGEAEHTGMPRASIATGMVDWVLPTAEIPQRVLDYFKLEVKLQLPPEEERTAAQPTQAQAQAVEEASLRDVLGFLRTRTGRDFSNYKRATIVRRIARRMQVNGLHDLHAYLNCLRTRPGESGALLQDLLISVTNFFRDADCFEALEREIPALLADKGPNEVVRVWVPACATGEEAYSVAMLLAEHAQAIDAPPLVQVFATDLDDAAVQFAREGVYPTAIAADVSEERLKRFFIEEHRGWRVRRELREMVLFATHDVLKDSPFSRQDLISCRNLLIYLNRDAQARVLDTFHFALRPGARLFLGSSESVEEGNDLFGVVDKKHRIYQQRPGPRTGLPMPVGRGALTRMMDARNASGEASAVAGNAFPGVGAVQASQDSRPSWGEIHLRLLEQLGPPSILVDSEYDIVHLSPTAGRFLQFAGGEPSRNLLRAVNPSVRIELRAALYRAAQNQQVAELPGVPVEFNGERVSLTIRVLPSREVGSDLFLVVLQAMAPEATPNEGPQPQRVQDDAVARQLDRELETLKSHLRDTVEQYEASTEELKASNEELQAMNEELRSASEELETSREELQSINEELTTVNQELKNNIDELGHANSDMQNLMDATAIATVFLDRELCITRFTPAAVSLFNLIATDIGRPLTDLKSRLRYPELGADAARVLEKLVPVEREVGSHYGNWYMARLLPYRTLEDRIAGVVLSFINVTERKQAEEMRLWLSAVVTASTDAIISFSLDGTIRSWNPGAQRIFGYTPAEAVGQPLSILTPDGESDPGRLLARIALAEPIDSHETVRLRKDGSELQVALTVSPIRDESGHVMAGTVIARDITAAKRAEEAMRQSEERMRLVMDNAIEFAILSMDLQRRMTMWNAGAERLLGYAGEEIIGQAADIIFTPEDREQNIPQKEVSTALAEGRASDDRYHLRKDGSRFWSSGVVMLMRDGKGEAVGFVKILRDQTVAQEAREALERSRTELLEVLAENERARAELQAADVAKDRFLAVLSHELRNPLASIDSAAELMLTAGVPAADSQAAAEVVRRQALATKAMLDDLLDVSRLKLGRLELKRERVRLSAVMASALEVTRPLLVDAPHALKLDLGEGDVELDGDPLRLVQVLSNLLSNAIKYTPRDGTIDVTARLTGDQLELSVKDTGIGMEPQRIPAMFDMFAQEDTRDRGRGLGIGLALVKNIVDLHDGQISARSEGRGKGSEFRVLLPGARPVAAARAATRLPAAPEPLTMGEDRGQILIADDNADAGWGLASLLEMAGFKTVRVTGGVEAVREIGLRRPQAAIVDIGMPDLNGHEVARQVRAAPWGREMVLIAATGWGQEADQRAALEAGFDAHMTKPLDARELSKMLETLLSSKTSLK
ncbi:CheR family methyltransferase [Ramlibacter tataouinensis]|uniref:CheR family methyltransferase n=1 Tax=Ramlibacter tataouinensis TaxID=94132 RepID=UPI00077802F2|nr:chemotaxis protein CheB [Ramlibacter tataouinensis]